MTLNRKYLTLDRKYVTLSNDFGRWEYKSRGNALNSRSNVPMLLSIGPRLVSNAAKSLCNAPLQATSFLKYVTCVGITRTYEPLFTSYIGKSRSNGSKLQSNAPVLQCNVPLLVTYVIEFVICVGDTRICVALYASNAAMLARNDPKLLGSQVKQLSNPPWHASNNPLPGRNASCQD